MIITTIDGKIMHNRLKTKNGKFSANYIVENNSKLLFEYVKDYQGDDLKRFGLGVNFYCAWFMMEGNYEMEYIVDDEFLIEQLKKKCNLTLVESDTFENQFNTYKYFFDNVVSFEDNPETKKSLLNVKNFYNFNDDINKNSYENTRLYRYYIFKR